MDLVSAYFAMCFVSIAVNLTRHRVGGKMQMHFITNVEVVFCCSRLVVKFDNGTFFKFISRNYTQSSLAKKKKFKMPFLNKKKNK